MFYDKVLVGSILTQSVIAPVYPYNVLHYIMIVLEWAKLAKQHGRWSSTRWRLLQWTEQQRSRWTTKRRAWSKRCTRWSRGTSIFSWRSRNAKVSSPFHVSYVSIGLVAMTLYICIKLLTCKAWTRKSGFIWNGLDVENTAINS